MSNIKRKVDNEDDEIEIEEQGKYIFIKLLQMSKKKYWDTELKEFNAHWRGAKRGWLIDKKHKQELFEFLEINEESSEEDLEQLEEKSPRPSRPHNKVNDMNDEKESESSDESSSTDDELIQKTLTRRILSESSGKSIDLENVEDSEMEDVISVCRRFRHVYTEIKHLKQRIIELENRLK